MKLLGRISLYFDRITTQLSALLVIASVVTFAIAGLFFLVLAPDRNGPMPSPDGAIRIATLLRGLDAVSPPARKELIAAYSQGPLTVKLDDGSAPGSVDPASRALLSRIVRDLPPGIRIVAIRSDQPSSVAVRAILRDGQAVTVNVLLDDGPFPPPPPFSPSGPPPPGPPPSHGPGYGPPMGPPNMPPPEPSFLSLPVLLPLIFLIASTILLSIWAARRLAAPLARFAAAVDRFSGAGIESPVREEGPSEIRQAARAFNRMRGRIIRLIEDRTTTLIAISHDLRTPLTRLRLRTEEIPASAEKTRMLEDLELMDSMIASAVTYLREGSGLETSEMADLPSIIETICDQFTDTGHTVVYEGPQRFAMLCRPQSLGRAISNLIENATKFGATVTARLTTSPESITIDVEDDGPGIPDEEKQRVMEPFYRMDPARQVTGGFGLGLAIVLAIAETHGGTLTLLDRQPRGLCARISFPAATSADLRAT
jgi:signal transduction histidine kinase